MEPLWLFGATVGGSCTQLAADNGCLLTALLVFRDRTYGRIVEGRGRGALLFSA